MTEQPPVPTQPPARPTARKSAPLPNEAPHAADIARMKAFLWIQILFLLASPLTGGFHFKMWSMLDTSLLLLSIGITNLAFVVRIAHLTPPDFSGGRHHLPSRCGGHGHQCAYVRRARLAPRHESHVGRLDLFFERNLGKAKGPGA